MKDRIRSGELKPGDRLDSERVLQGKLGVSRFSLREGLARLSALGLVRTEHGRGTFVAGEVDPQSLADVLLHLRADGCEERTAALLEARTFLEGELSALAAERGSDEGFVALEVNIEDAAGRLDDVEAFCDDDLAFHQVIARMAENPFLYQMHTALWEHIKPVMRRNAATRKAREDILDRHRGMLEALRSRDVGRVRELSRRFLALGLQNYY